MGGELLWASRKVFPRSSIPSGYLQTEKISISIAQWRLGTHKQSQGLLKVTLDVLFAFYLKYTLKNNQMEYWGENSSNAQLAESFGYMAFFSQTIHDNL